LSVAAPSPPGTPAVPYGEADTLTTFASSDDKLNAVWELVSIMLTDCDTMHCMVI
jgi:hypothetical protein